METKAKESGVTVMTMTMVVRDVSKRRLKEIDGNCFTLNVVVVGAAKRGLSEIKGEATFIALEVGRSSLLRRRRRREWKDECNR